MTGTSLAYKLVTSPFGDMGLVWVQKDYSPSIVRILLPGKDMAMVEIIGRFFPCAVRQTNDTIEKICGQIQEFMKGNKVDFSLGYLDMNNCYEFQRKVLLENKKIPRGMVISYGRLAGKIHVPQGARAVGSALAGNPFPVIIPCHRVIRSNGELGGFGGGLKMKRTLLEMEGVGFDSKGRVSQNVTTQV